MPPAGQFYRRIQSREFVPGGILHLSLIPPLERAAWANTLCELLAITTVVDSRWFLDAFSGSCSSREEYNCYAPTLVCHTSSIDCTLNWEMSNSTICTGYIITSSYMWRLHLRNNYWIRLCSAVARSVVTCWKILYVKSSLGAWELFAHRSANCQRTFRSRFYTPLKPAAADIMEKCFPKVNGSIVQITTIRPPHVVLWKQRCGAAARELLCRTSRQPRTGSGGHSDGDQVADKRPEIRPPVLCSTWFVRSYSTSSASSTSSTIFSLDSAFTSYGIWMP